MSRKCRVGIVDYGLGNLTSVAGAIKRLECEPMVTGEARELMRADGLVLPGVGAFGDGMNNLRERGLVEALEEAVHRREIPILCICLGFQLLASRSSEFGEHQGLGWIDGRIERLRPVPDDLRVPHVGWNELHQAEPCSLFEGIPEDALFYYVHSYEMLPADRDCVTGECNYGGTFVASVQKGNIHGVQFHPEKSQRHGLQLLRNFTDSL